MLDISQKAQKSRDLTPPCSSLHLLARKLVQHKRSSESPAFGQGKTLQKTAIHLPSENSTAHLCVGSMQEQYIRERGISPQNMGADSEQCSDQKTVWDEGVL